MSGNARASVGTPSAAAAMAGTSARSPSATPSSEVEILLRRVERERQARKQAEQLLELKSAEQYEVNQRVQAETARLELAVQDRKSVV